MSTMCAPPTTVRCTSAHGPCSEIGGRNEGGKEHKELSSAVKKSINCLYKVRHVASRTIDLIDLLQRSHRGEVVFLHKFSSETNKLLPTVSSTNRSWLCDIASLQLTVSQQQNRGNSPLHLAAASGHLDVIKSPPPPPRCDRVPQVVKALARANASINIVNPVRLFMSSFSAQRHAAIAGSCHALAPGCCQLYWHAQGTACLSLPEVKDLCSSCWTWELPCDVRMQTNRWSLVLCEETSADVLQTVLHYAARSGNLATIAELLARGFRDLEAFDKWNRQPLHWAILNEHADAVELLLQNGAKKEPALIPDRVHRSGRL
eukprot:675480-Hanusia_phi.AAC.3